MVKLEELFMIRDLKSKGLSIRQIAEQLDIDPKINDLEPLWPCCNDVEDIKNFRHLNLFYELRNALIHELRIKGHAFKLFESDKPHYMHLTATVGPPDNITLSIDSFELFYPVPFFQNL